MEWEHVKSMEVQEPDKIFSSNDNYVIGNKEE